MLCAFPGFSVCGAEDLRPVLRFGMMAFLQEGTPSGFTTYVNADDYVLRKLPQILSQSLPEYRVDVKVYRTAALIKAARSGKVDVIFGSSGCYASLLPDGIYPLATLVTNFAPDPNRAVAGAVVVSSRRTDLNSLKDLKHLSAMSGLESMFFNWQMRLLRSLTEAWIRTASSVPSDRWISPCRKFCRHLKTEPLTLD